MTKNYKMYISYTEKLRGSISWIFITLWWIIYFPNGIPDDLLLDNNKSILPQGV